MHTRYGVPKTKTDGELIDEVKLYCHQGANAEGHVDGGGDGGGASDLHAWQ